MVGRALMVMAVTTECDLPTRRERLRKTGKAMARLTSRRSGTYVARRAAQHVLESDSKLEGDQTGNP